MNTLDQPIVWIPLVGVVLAFVIVLAASKARGVKRMALGAAAALCLLLPSYLLAAVHAPHWIDARFRAYKVFHDEIQVGMSRAEVLSAREKHYPANGPRQRPKIMQDTASELGFFMNPEHSHEPNCEGIFLDLKDGLVTRKRYSRD